MSAKPACTHSGCKTKRLYTREYAGYEEGEVKGKKVIKRKLEPVGFICGCCNAWVPGDPPG